MAGIIGDSNINPGPFVELREQRQAARDSRINEATGLISAQRLEPGEIAEHQSIYNTVIDDGGRLKSPSFGGGLLNMIFEQMERDRHVDEGTRPQPQDNGKAADIKREYKDAYTEVRRETAEAGRIAFKLGPGTHKLSNGDTVTVTEDPRNSKTTVTTVHADGSTKTVTTGSETSVKKTWPDGLSSETRLDGTHVSRREKSPFGETRFDYDLDSSGRVVRDKKGPAKDDDEHTVVNHDGSTDSRNYIYTDENGRKAYEDKHEKGRGKAPHPWPENDGGHRPFPPLPMPQPDPLPWPPKDEDPHPWHPRESDSDPVITLPDGTKIRVHGVKPLDPNPRPFTGLDNPPPGTVS